MFIQRLEVENEGFLSGLDLEFVPGLNVIIGARGTGKTSLIEVIRYVLGAGGFTTDAAGRGEQQALAVLQGGAATISLADAQGRHNITKSSSGHVTSTLPYTPRCTVLAQNEVEAVGAQASGRLHLIDRFRRETVDERSDVNRLTLGLQSLTSELRAVIADGAGIAEQMQAYASLNDELDAALAAQQALLEHAKATSQQREALASLEAASKTLAARDAVIRDNLDNVRTFARDLGSLRDRATNLVSPSHDDSLGDEALHAARSHTRAVAETLGAAVLGIAEAEKALQQVRSADAELRNRVDEQSRALRQVLDSVQSGVGASSRRVQELQERMGQLAALNQRLADRRAKYLDVQAQRDALYEQLETLRDQVFRARAAVAHTLNDALGPNIRIRLSQSDQVDRYQSAIVSGLRGSKLHYNSLAPLIARSLSPYELVSWVEGGQTEELSKALDLTTDRAAALIAALRQSGTPEIISSTIEDGVTLELLDGKEYKATDRLSIGQRCTVVLPVLLAQHGDPLLVDQPEDHLDNAFIASTLVPALRRRGPDDQFIFTSHNANIPVLGEADRVIVMDSDGDRGYVAAAGPIDDPAIVEAVTRIMEGGQDAFAARADFYSKNRWGRR